MAEHVEVVSPTESELRAFIGPSADRYWRKWRWYIEHEALRPSGLWPPFLFNFIWFLYRRMYRELWIPILLAAGLGVVQGLAEFVVELRLGTPYSLPAAVDTTITLGLGFATSYVGSFLYLRKLRNAVAKARQAHPDADTQLAALKAAGGTSYVAAAVGIAVAVLIAMINIVTMESSG